MSQTELRDKDYLRGFFKEKNRMTTLEKASSTRNKMLHSQAPFINNTENKKSITK